MSGGASAANWMIRGRAKKRVPTHRARGYGLCSEALDRYLWQKVRQDRDKGLASVWVLIGLTKSPLAVETE